MSKTRNAHLTEAFKPLSTACAAGACRTASRSRGRLWGRARALDAVAKLFVGQFLDGGAVDADDFVAAVDQRVGGSAGVTAVCA